MKRLIKHDLDCEQVLPYVMERLGKANFLSLTIQELIDFKTGVFFTLLPSEAHLSQIYKLDKGILPRGKIVDVNSFDKKYSIEAINSIRDELANYLYKMMRKKPSISFISDDVKRYSTDHNDHELFVSSGVCLERDVYYLINGTTATSSIILKALQESNAFWHSLSILTAANFESVVNRKITKEKIQECCLNSTLLIIGAYDGEGYVFWEKSPNSCFP